jgi:ferredoxin
MFCTQMETTLLEKISEWTRPPFDPETMREIETLVRDKDEKGKPITRPVEFYIDASICMNCGLCAEFCPFDAIKMNLDYELGYYVEDAPDGRMVLNKSMLMKPDTFHASIHPSDWALEVSAKAAESAKPAKGAPAAKPAAPAAAAPVAAAPKPVEQDLFALRETPPPDKH